MSNLLQPVPPIKVEPPPVSILTVARTLPAGTVWRSGVSFLPNGCSSAVNYPNCDQYGEDGAPIKCAPEPTGAASFQSWLMYVPDGCQEKPFYAEDWNARAREALEAYSAWAVSREMSDGAQSGNPSLQSTATDISGAGAVKIVTAISSLIRARVEAGFGGVATLHVPAWFMPPLLNTFQLTRAGGALTAEDGLLRVSPGPGYLGAAPDGTPAVAGQGCLYITGPVEAEVGPVEVMPDRAEQQRLTNNVEVYAERPAIYRFDPCGVFAVMAKVDD